MLAFSQWPSSNPLADLMIADITLPQDVRLLKIRSQQERRFPSWEISSQKPHQPLTEEQSLRNQTVRQKLDLAVIVQASQVGECLRKKRRQIGGISSKVKDPRVAKEGLCRVAQGMVAIILLHGVDLADRQRRPHTRPSPSPSWSARAVSRADAGQPSRLRRGPIAFRAPTPDR